MKLFNKVRSSKELKQVFYLVKDKIKNVYLTTILLLQVVWLVFFLIDNVLLLLPGFGDKNSAFLLVLRRLATCCGRRTFLGTRSLQRLVPPGFHSIWVRSSFLYSEDWAIPYEPWIDRCLVIFAPVGFKLW